MNVYTIQSRKMNVKSKNHPLSSNKRAIVVGFYPFFYGERIICNRTHGTSIKITSLWMHSFIFERISNEMASVLANGVSSMCKWEIIGSMGTRGRERESCGSIAVSLTNEFEFCSNIYFVENKPVFIWKWKICILSNGKSAIAVPNEFSSSSSFFFFFCLFKWK